MSDHDVDDEIRRRLRQGVTAPAASGHELTDLRPRFERARRRRRAAAGGGAAMAAVLVVVGAVTLAGGTDQPVRVADDTSASSTTRATTTSTTTAVAPTTVPPTTVPDTAPTTVPDTAPIVAPTTVVGGAAPRSTSSPTTTAPVTPPAPSTTVKPGGLRVLDATGGTVTVVWTPVSIVVDGTTPAAGWELDRVEQKDPTRVVVTFRRPGGGSGSSTSTIDARVVDGRLEVH